MKRLLWRALEWPLGLALLLWSRVTMATVRLETAPALETKPAIFVHWHQHLPLLMPLLGARRCAVMMSAAPHMAPIARWARLLGFELVRGASGEKGREALEGLAAALARGRSVELAVDGPRGPVFRARPGAAELALATGVPIVALAYHARGAFIMPGRWDRQVMLRPFARVRLVVERVDALPGDTTEALLGRVQSTLERLASTPYTERAPLEGATA